MRKISVWFGRIIGIIAVIISVGYEIFAFFDDFYLNFIGISCIETFLYGLFHPLAKIYISNGSIFIDSPDIYYQIFPRFLFLSVCNVIAIIFCFIELVKFFGFLFRKTKGNSFAKVLIVIYIALGLVFSLCIYELMCVADALFFYFRSGYTYVSIPQTTIIAFYGAIITPIVAILFPIVFFIIRKIVIIAKEKASASRAAKEEALYQRFKERMEREKRR